MNNIAKAFSNVGEFITSKITALKTGIFSGKNVTNEPITPPSAVQVAKASESNQGMPKVSDAHLDAHQPVEEGPGAQPFAANNKGGEIIEVSPVSSPLAKQKAAQLETLRTTAKKMSPILDDMHAVRQAFKNAKEAGSNKQLMLKLELKTLTMETPMTENEINANLNENYKEAVKDITYDAKKDAAEWIKFETQCRASDPAGSTPLEELVKEGVSDATLTYLLGMTMLHECSYDTTESAGPVILNCLKNLRAVYEAPYNDRATVVKQSDALNKALALPQTWNAFVSLLNGVDKSSWAELFLRPDSDRTGSTPLHIAAKNNSAGGAAIMLMLNQILQSPSGEEKIKNLLEASVPDSKRKTSGTNLVRQLAEASNTAALMYLKNNLGITTAGWNQIILKQDERGHSIIHTAIASGKLDVARTLFSDLSTEDKRQLVQHRDTNGQTLLHILVGSSDATIADWRTFSSALNSDEIAAICRSEGTVDGLNPLFVAIKTGNNGIRDAIMGVLKDSSSATLLGVTSNGDNIFHIIGETGNSVQLNWVKNHCSTADLQRLLIAPNNNGLSPISSAIQGSMQQELREGNMLMASALLELIAPEQRIDALYGITAIKDASLRSFAARLTVDSIKWLKNEVYKALPDKPETEKQAVWDALALKTNEHGNTLFMSVAQALKDVKNMPVGPLRCFFDTLGPDSKLAVLTMQNSQGNHPLALLNGTDSVIANRKSVEDLFLYCLKQVELNNWPQILMMETDSGARLIHDSRVTSLLQAELNKSTPPINILDLKAESGETLLQLAVQAKDVKVLSGFINGIAPEKRFSALTSPRDSGNSLLDLLAAEPGSLLLLENALKLQRPPISLLDLKHPQTDGNLVHWAAYGGKVDCLTELWSIIPDGDPKRYASSERDRFGNTPVDLATRGAFKNKKITHEDSNAVQEFFKQQQLSDKKEVVQVLKDAQVDILKNTKLAAAATDALVRLISKGYEAEYKTEALKILVKAMKSGEIQCTESQQSIVNSAIKSFEASIQFKKVDPAGINPIQFDWMQAKQSSLELKVGPGVDAVRTKSDLGFDVAKIVNDADIVIAQPQADNKGGSLKLTSNFNQGSKDSPKFEERKSSLLDLFSVNYPDSDQTKDVDKGAQALRELSLLVSADSIINLLSGIQKTKGGVVLSPEAGSQKFNMEVAFLDDGRMKVDFIYEDDVATARNPQDNSLMDKDSHIGCHQRFSGTVTITPSFNSNTGKAKVNFESVDHAFTA